SNIISDIHIGDIMVDIRPQLRRYYYYINVESRTGSQYHHDYHYLSPPQQNVPCASSPIHILPNR
ncbi:MAG TPA: hypothetical protein VF884_08305, partial [Nitrososphaeraceae archaeon]